MCDFLVNVEWNNVLSSENVNYIWIALKNTILEARSKFVPNNNKPNSKPPWLKKSIQKEIKNKQAAFKQYLKTKKSNDLHKYKIQRNKVKDFIRKAKADYRSSFISDLKSNPKWVHKAEAKSKTGPGWWNNN